MMTKEGSTRVVTFMTPRTGVLVIGWGHISHIVKIHYFFKNLLLHSRAYIRLTKYKVMMTKKRVYKNCNFHDPWSRGSCARVWPYKSYSENALFLKISSLLLCIHVDQTNYV